MASNIISTTIDETYPVAGQDNDSQGFRDNFTIIKDNFAYAKDEIETLQDNTAKLNADNAYGYNTQENLVLKNYLVTAAVGEGVITSASDAALRQINYNSGHFHTKTVGDNLTLTFVNWPVEEAYTEMFIKVKTTGGAAYTVTLASTGAAAIHQNGIAGAQFTMTTDTSVSYLIKAFTFDAGANVYIQSVGNFTEII